MEREGKKEKGRVERARHKTEEKSEKRDSERKRVLEKKRV